MSTHITSSFKIESWDETAFSQSENGPKLTRANVSQTYSGDLKAKSTIEYLMITFKDESSTFIGTEEVIGELNGREGSFILDHKGTHENGIAKSTFRIIPNSGTGQLKGIHGEGSYEATHEEAELTLNYFFEE